MWGLVSGDVRLVEGWPALLLKRTLVIADVHLGIEKDLWRQGVLVDGVSELAVKRFEELLKITRPRKIIINGDLRHNIPLFTRKESENVKKFVEVGETFGEVVVVKGNHDGDIEKIIDNVVKGGLKIKDFYITHGHKNTSHRPAIIGHLHPAFPIDMKFKRESIKVWLISESVIVLPAFSPYITGNDVTNPENWLGPIARKEKSFEVFTLDGSYIGRVENRSGSDLSRID